MLKTHKTLFLALTQNVRLTFISPCIANIFAEYNQQDVTFLNLFISVRWSTCFRRFFRQSSGTQNFTYSVRYWSDKYLTLYVQFCAPGDGRKDRLKHVECLTEINKLRNVASWWLYSANKRYSLNEVSRSERPLCAINRNNNCTRIRSRRQNEERA